jgi:hypothetical protein
MSVYLYLELEISGYRPDLEDEIIDALDDSTDGEASFADSAQTDDDHSLISSSGNLRLRTGWSLNRFAADITLRVAAVDPGARVEIASDDGTTLTFSAADAAAIAALGEAG